MARTHPGMALGLVLLAFQAAPLTGQGQDSRSTDSNARAVSDSHAAAAVVAVARLSAAIAVDARLTESAWRTAVPVTRLIQTEPDEGRPVTQRTEIRVLYDDDALYVGAVLHDTAPVTTRLARRDADLQDTDWFAVLLDSYHDHLTAYRFAINPSGVKRDEIMTGASMFGGDRNWDPVWDGATTVSDSGWVVEMRIPFSQLRYSREPQQTWGIQLERRIGSNHEVAVLEFTPRDERGGVARYGHLVGLEQIKADAGRLEVLPYLLGRADYRTVAQNSSVSFPNPFTDGSLHSAGVGGDVKFRPTSNITINATVNPDFGQVELDPAVTNLTAFETRFEEKRPFFVEGSDLFRFGGGDSRGGMGGGGGFGGFGAFGGGGGSGGGGGGPAQLVYSRRIGRSPQLGVPSEAVYSEIPDATTILGAAKITARSASGWSLGMIEAVTARESASYVEEGGARLSAPVEPLTNYLAGRIRKDMRSGQTVVGGLVTAVNRDLANDRMVDGLRSAAYAGGVDFSHEWNNRQWSFNGYLSGSYIRGSEGVMIRAQRSSARYYQRPDADHLSVDSAATTLSGYSGRFDIGKRSGKWRGNAVLSVTSPGYEVNDLGFQTSADRYGLDLNFNYQENTPGAVLRRWDLRLGPDLSWNFGGQLVRSSLGLGGGGQLSNFWNYRFNFSRDFETWDDRLTRGGVLSRNPAETGGFLFISSDSRAAYGGRLTLSANRNSAGGWRWSTNVDFNARPADNLDFSIGPNLSRSRSTAQYLTSVSDPLATTTFGRRYLFATIDQTTLSIETRVNVTFSPTLSLELYAQPFASSGDYGPVKQLRAPGTYEFDVFGQDVGSAVRDADANYVIDPDGPGPASAFEMSDPNFNQRSVRGNAVLRWEWRPGSAFFLVWQQNRSGRLTWDSAGADRVGDFALGREVPGIFDLRPDNVFIFKISYWLNP